MGWRQRAGLVSSSRTSGAREGHRQGKKGHRGASCSCRAALRVELAVPGKSPAGQEGVRGSWPALLRCCRRAGRAGASAEPWGCGAGQSRSGAEAGASLARRGWLRESRSPSTKSCSLFPAASAGLPPPQLSSALFSGQTLMQIKAVLSCWGSCWQAHICQAGPGPAAHSPFPPRGGSAVPATSQPVTG